MTNRLKTFRVYKLLSGLKQYVFSKEFQDGKEAGFKGSTEFYGPQGKPFRLFVQSKTEDMALIRRALVYADREDEKNAIASFEEAIKKNPTNEWSWLELGLIYRNYSGMLVFFTCGTAAPGCGLPVDTAGGGCATKFCR